MRLSVDKPETTRHSTCNKPRVLNYTQLYVHHHQYLTDIAGVIGNKREIFQCNETREILLKVDYGTVHLITYAHIHMQTCASRFEYDYWRLFINLYKWKTMNNSRWINIQSNLKWYKVTWPSVCSLVFCLGSQGR